MQPYTHTHTHAYTSHSLPSSPPELDFLKSIPVFFHFHCSQLTSSYLQQHWTCECEMLHRAVQIEMSTSTFSFVFLSSLSFRLYWAFFLFCFTNPARLFFSFYRLQPAARSQRTFRLTPRTTRPLWWRGSVLAWFTTQPSTGTPSPTRGCRAETRASRTTGQTGTRTWYGRIFTSLHKTQHPCARSPLTAWNFC